MSATVSVIEHRTYAVACANACTVATPEGLVLCEVVPNKLSYFTAMGGEVVVSDPTAIVKLSFNPAPAGSASGGGESNVSDCAALGDVYSPRAGVVETLNVGEPEQSLAYLVYLSRAHAPIGKLRQLSWQVPTNENLAADVFTPHYLAVYEIITPATADADAVVRFVGCSTEAVTQVMGEAAVFEFEDAECQGGDLQLSLATSPVTADDDPTPTLGAEDFFFCSATPATDDDAYSALIVINGQDLAAAPYVLDCSFVVEEPAKFVTEPRVAAMLAGVGGGTSSSDIASLSSRIAQLEADSSVTVLSSSVGTLSDNVYGLRASMITLISDVKVLSTEMDNLSSSGGGGGVTLPAWVNAIDGDATGITSIKVKATSPLVVSNQYNTPILQIGANGVHYLNMAYTAQIKLTNSMGASPIMRFDVTKVEIISGNRLTFGADAGAPYLDVGVDNALCINGSEIQVI